MQISLKTNRFNDVKMGVQDLPPSLNNIFEMAYSLGCIEKRIFFKITLRHVDFYALVFADYEYHIHFPLKTKFDPRRPMLSFALSASVSKIKRECKISNI